MSVYEIDYHSVSTFLSIATAVQGAFLLLHVLTHDFKLRSKRKQLHHRCSKGP